MNLTRHALFLLVGLVFAIPFRVLAGDNLKLFPDSQFISRDRFSVEIVGKGPDLIFVPGLASARETWKESAVRLRGKYRLHLVQVSGFAGEPVGGNASGDVLVPVAEAIDAYIVDRHLAPATLIGHSLGGTMALYLAIHHGDHLKKVLLVDALPFYSLVMAGPNATVESVKPIADAMRANPAPLSDARLDVMIAGMVTSPDNRQTIKGWSRASDGSVVVRAMTDDMLLDMRPDLAAIKTPVTLFYPDYVPAGMPAGQAQQMYGGLYALVAKKTLVRFDNSLHFIMLDQPAAFATALDAFLK